MSCLGKGHVALQKVIHHAPIESRIEHGVHQQVIQLPIVEGQHVERAVDPGSDDARVAYDLLGAPDVRHVGRLGIRLVAHQQVKIRLAFDGVLGTARILGVVLVGPAQALDRSADRLPAYEPSVVVVSSRAILLAYPLSANPALPVPWRHTRGYNCDGSGQSQSAGRLRASWPPSRHRVCQKTL